VGEGRGEDADEEWGVAIREMMNRVHLNVSTCEH
jgi:hypothetical protein